MLYGITLVGAAVFGTDPEPPTWGFPCRRSTGPYTATSVPPRTAQRARAIALELAADWLGRPDRLLDAHRMWKAPARLAAAQQTHQRALERLATGRVDVLDLGAVPATAGAA